MKHQTLGLARREFLGIVVAGGSLAGVTGTVRARSDGALRATKEAKEAIASEHFPGQDPELVEQVVRFSHFDLERVTELVEAKPELAKASWDWGFGDWESAIGAASHTGRREIVEVLLANGARPDIFTLAMLGRLESVRAVIEAHSGFARIPGPHGITLMAHAKAGGRAAADVVAYLESVPGANEVREGAPWGEASPKMYLGMYRFGDSDDARFEIIEQQRGLALQPAVGASRPLRHLGDHAFSPMGAPSVRIRFDMDGSRATRVVVHDPDPALTAELVPGWH